MEYEEQNLEELMEYIKQNDYHDYMTFTPKELLQLVNRIEELKSISDEFVSLTYEHIQDGHALYEYAEKIEENEKQKEMSK